MNDAEWYNQKYLFSKEYKKPPEKCIYYPIWDFISEKVDAFENIYDIGCGPGHLASLLIKKGKNFIHGWDISDVAINMAKKLTGTNRFSVRNLFDLDRFKETDTIIATEVLEHLDEDRRVLNLLSPGTRFIFSVPNYLAKQHRRKYPNLQYIIKRYPELEIKSSDVFFLKNTNFIFLIDSTLRNGSII